MASVTFSLLCVAVVMGTSLAWRPQGRFGKRRLEPEGSHPQQNPLEAFSSEGRDSSGYPEELDTPVFQHGNIICINKGIKGIFRCVRWISPNTTD